MTNLKANPEKVGSAISSEPPTAMTALSQASIQQALNIQVEQLDFAVLSALNQRRQIALAARPSRWDNWLNAGAFKFALPAAIACGAAVFALSFALRMPLAPISDADAALLAEFESSPLQLVGPEAFDPMQELTDDELELMSGFEINGLAFYAWIDQQPVPKQKDI